MFTTSNYSPNYEDNITIGDIYCTGVTPALQTEDGYSIMVVDQFAGGEAITIDGEIYYHTIYTVDKLNSNILGHATYEGKDIYGYIDGYDVPLCTITDGVVSPILYEGTRVSFGDWS